MNNIQWDDFHKNVIGDPDPDKDMIKFIKRFYHADKDPKTMLDLGCGQGSNTLYLSDMYKDWKVYGCDYSSKALCITNTRVLGRSNVFLKQCDANDTKYKDNQFDIIINVALFASVNPEPDIIKELHRILKPKGRLFIKEISTNECNNNNEYLRRGKNVIKYDSKQLYSMLIDNGFERVETNTSRIEHQNIEHIICVGRKK